MRAPIPIAAAALALASCGGTQGSGELAGSWRGSVSPPRPFYTDELQLTLRQDGSVVTGHGFRGVPCPADGTCYAAVSAAGTFDGANLTLQLTGPYPGERFDGRLQDSSTLVGVFTVYWGTPPITLRRVESAAAR